MRNYADVVAGTDADADAIVDREVDVDAAADDITATVVEVFSSCC